jgi:hypothetical protein
MENTQYEVCLHHLTAEHNAAAWNNSPVRLEVYADGVPLDDLTKFNGGSDTWDLSDALYRFSTHVDFRLVELVAAGPAGSEHLSVLATFSLSGEPTETSGAHAHDENSGYRLDYTIYAVERAAEPVVQWAAAGANA